MIRETKFKWIVVSPTSKIQHAVPASLYNEPIVKQQTVCGILMPIAMLQEDHIKYRNCKRCFAVLRKCDIYVQGDKDG